MHVDVCIIKDFLPVVADNLLILLLALFCIKGQLPDALTSDLLTIVFPEQPHFLFILCLHWIISICCCINLKPRKDQSNKQQKNYF